MNSIIQEALKKRQTDHEVNELFPGRWSPRAMSGEEITNKELMSLFEAARWAPSSFNGQPWKFIYAKRNTEYWNKLFNLMGEFNQTWTKNAAVLIVIISQNNFEYNGKPNRTHSFCTGAAWENLALQAADMGLVCHGMAGFDYNKTKKELEIPEDYTVEAMAAIGKLGKKEDLSEEMQEKETPSDRKKATKITMEGKFNP